MAPRPFAHVLPLAGTAGTCTHRRLAAAHPRHGQPFHTHPRTGSRTHSRAQAPERVPQPRGALAPHGLLATRPRTSPRPRRPAGLPHPRRRTPGGGQSPAVLTGARCRGGCCGARRAGPSRGSPPWCRCRRTAAGRRRRGPGTARRTPAARRRPAAPPGPPPAARGSGPPWQRAAGSGGAAAAHHRGEERSAARLGSTRLGSARLRGESPVGAHPPTLTAAPSRSPGSAPALAPPSRPARPDGPPRRRPRPSPRPRYPRRPRERRSRPGRARAPRSAEPSGLCTAPAEREGGFGSVSPPGTGAAFAEHPSSPGERRAAAHRGETAWEPGGRRESIPTSPRRCQELSHALMYLREPWPVSHSAARNPVPSSTECG